MKKIAFRFSLMLLVLCNMIYVYGQAEATVYQEKKVWRVAVFPITYADVPANYLDSFPDKTEIERLIFHDKIQDYYKFISNDEFVLVGDVFEYTINPNTSWTSAGGLILSDQQILDGINFNAPSFNSDDYDLVMFLSGHDATMSSPSNVGEYTYTINGTTYTDQIGLVLYYQIGFDGRDPMNFYNNSWKVKDQYLIPLGGGISEEADVWHNLSQTEATCNHEFGHSMGVWSHSNSATNGALPIDLPETPNNDNFLNRGYGNSYCLMGTQQYSPSLNGYFRNVTGILPQDEVVKVDDYGTFQITIDPINTVSNKRHAEVLLPHSKSTLGFKNTGYGLEARSAASYDTLLNHPQLIANSVT